MTRQLRIDDESGGEKGKSADLLSVLPECCVATVVSLSSPVDAGRLAVVSSIFRSAAESDSVWERFLPHDYRALLPPSLCHDAKCKKQLYLTLCDRPVLIDQGRKSFSMEKWSGKKCYMLSARDLSIIWGDNPRNWRWVSLPDSRFSEVAELIDVCWLEIRGRVSTGLLSSMTHYRAYLVFNTTSAAYGLDYHPAEAVVALAGTEGKKKTLYLGTAGKRRQQRQMVPRRVTRFARLGILELPPQPQRGRSGMRHTKERTDGWLEIELGEFFNEGSKDGELEMSVLEVRGGNWKSGLIVQGIDIRPRGYVTRVGTVNNR